MNILILSVTAGQGHNATARALSSLFEENGHTVTVIDTLRETNRFLYHVVDKGYLLAASRCKRLYGKSYYRLEKRRANAYQKSFTRRMFGTLTKKLKKKIDAIDPDAILCTHVLPAVLLDILREKHGLRAVTCGIVTDFTMHPYWEEALRLDVLVLACDKLIPNAERKGFSRDQIVTTGIPIKPCFAEEIDRGDAKRALGFDPEKPLILMMNGSMGYGKPARLVRELNDSPFDIQIVSVAGNNKKAFRAIEKTKKKKPLLNLGFTDKVPLLMSAADLLVSKPGGLTTEECLAKRLPLIACNPIPGQEVHNSAFLTEQGAALAIDKKTSLTAVLETYLSDPSLAENMLKSVEELRRPHAARDLCRIMEEAVDARMRSK